jgi:sec-independent protein translocase protein TatB
VFGIGWSELLVISLAVLVFLGPKDLPRLMNKLGRLMRELQVASRDLRNQLEVELEDVPSPKKIADDLAGEAESLVSGPYAEARELDAQLKRELEEAKPRFEPEPAPPKPADGEGTGGHAG